MNDNQPIIYAEWVCRNCKGIHRTKFPLITYYPTNAKRPMYEEKTVKIDDPAYSIDVSGGKEHVKRSKHAIYTNPETPFKTVIEVLRNYILEFYVSEENSLKVDVCFE